MIKILKNEIIIQEDNKWNINELKKGNIELFNENKKITLKMEKVLKEKKEMERQRDEAKKSELFYRKKNIRESKRKEDCENYSKIIKEKDEIIKNKEKENNRLKNNLNKYVNDMETKIKDNITEMEIKINENIIEMENSKKKLHESIIELENKNKSMQKQNIRIMKINKEMCSQLKSYEQLLSDRKRVIDEKNSEILNFHFKTKDLNYCILRNK